MRWDECAAAARAPPRWIVRLTLLQHDWLRAKDVEHLPRDEACASALTNTASPLDDARMKAFGFGRGAWIAVTLALAAVACGETKTAPTAPPTTTVATRTPTPASASAAASASTSAPVELGVQGFLFVTYMAKPPTAAEVEASKARVRKAATDVPLVDDPKRAEPPMVQVFTASGADLQPISPSTLQLFAHGLDDSAKAAASAAQGALGTLWILDRDDTHRRMKAALAVARDNAVALHGLVWDDTLRMLYTPTAFDAERIASWQGDVPDVRRQIVQHYYEDEGRHRAVTLGLQGLAVPDLVVQDVPVALSGRVGDIMNVIAQRLVEGAHPSPAGDLEVDLAQIQHEGVRKAFQSTTSAPIVVRLTPVKPEEGDAENALLAIEFPGFAAPTEAERQGLAAAKLFGLKPDDLTGARADDAELLAIQARVQKKLPELAKRFRAGVPLGTRFSVKAPFDTDDGNVEWMWVEVVEWKADAELKGNLTNAPSFIKALHLGASVVVKASSVADYLWVSPDGKHEGGESSDVLGKRR